MKRLISNPRSNLSALKKLAVCVGLAFTLGACSLPPSKSTPIARVNGSPITFEDYQKTLETLRPKEIPMGAENKAELRNLVIKTLVRREVVLTEAKRKNILITQDELDEAFRKFKEGYTETSFEQNLSEEMIDLAAWRRGVEQSLLIEKLFAESAPQIPTPTTQEALEYFENHRHLFQKKASVKALHIVVAQEELAKEISGKLKKRPGDFVALAREHSTGPEGRENAQISVERDTLPEELDTALFDSKLGSISNVIKSPYGFHIIKVIDRTPPLNMDFHRVKPEILNRLTKERRREWIDRFEERLIRTAQIEYNRELVETL